MRLTSTLMATALLCTACGGGGGDPSAPDTGAPAALRQALQATPATRQTAASAVPSLATVSADQVMDWAEAHMADRFPGHASTASGRGFVYRYYPGSGNFIAVNDAGDVAVLQPQLSERVGYVGTLSGLGCTVNPQLTCLPFTAFTQGMYGEWPTQTYVIRTEDEWAKAWDAHAASLSLPSPLPQRPAIDFSRHMLLGVSRGWGGGCDSFSIRRLIDQAGTVRVEYADPPTPPYMACPAVAFPKASFVLVARSNQPVVFVEVSG